MWSLASKVINLNPAGGPPPRVKTDINASRLVPGYRIPDRVQWLWMTVHMILQKHCILIILVSSSHTKDKQIYKRRFVASVAYKIIRSLE